MAAFGPSDISGANVPNIKAAEKWQRQTERRAKRNLDVKTRLKTLFRKAKGLPEQAASVEEQFDKAARKGIIHPNKAARKKSRLTRAIRAAAVAAAALAAAPPAPARKRTATKKK